ncbi:MAG: NAD(+)/NADH kinase [Nitrososphaerales archaeon]
MVKKALLLIKDKHEGALKASLKIKDILKAFRVNYSEEFLSDKDLDLKFEDVDLLISVGGDGTIIRCSRIVKANIPILGINAGGRGILAEVKPQEFQEALEKILKGNFIIEQRMRIKVEFKGKSYPPVMNEVLLIRAEPLHTPTFKLIFSKEDELSEKMDGLLVSTPTGTTGHSYSLGGPITYENLELFIVTPIAPLNRLPSLILPPNPLSLVANQECLLVLDGQFYEKVDSGEMVQVKKHEEPVRFVRLHKRSLRQLHNLGF